jgi:hypothetical protein
MSESLTIALAERDAFRDALRDVMRLLRATAGSPAERKVYEHARGLLAAAGVNAAEAAQYQSAYEQWEERVAKREKQRTCKHETELESWPPQCADCGKRLAVR